MNTTTDATTATPRPPATRENGFARFWHKFTHFLKEVEVELRKTSWPTRNELTKFTIVVMVTIVVVSIYLFVCDRAFWYISKTLFKIS
ncbi:MAG: preprotein translocase subunit SecE [Armatimonadota bacterium]